MPTAAASPPPAAVTTRPIVFCVCFAVAFLAVWLMSGLPDLTPARQRALFILLVAGLLWITEAIPAFAVGILVIGMDIALLGKPGGVFARTSRDWEAFVGVMGNPLIWLFFGGFVLAAGMQRCQLDRWLAVRLFARFGSKPAGVLMGVMSVTFLLSMFMSNTATTAMMIAVVFPLLASFDATDRFGRALLLGIAVAANLGGMGTLIGSPPNALAAAALSNLTPPTTIGFLQWMLIGLPPALVLLAASWALLLRLYPASVSTIPLEALSAPANTVADPEAPTNGGARRADWRTFVVAATLIGTVGLWLTSPWHGIPTAAVSFLPIVVLTATGVLGSTDIRGLNYDVLFLMAGGLALGHTVSATGLSEWIVARLPFGGLSILGIAIAMAVATVALSNFMSNTAAANILIPIGIGFAPTMEAGIAIPVAIAASAAMCLPVSTPPNAMIYATGRCRASDFLIVGAVVGVLTPACSIAWLWLAGGGILGIDF